MSREMPPSRKNNESIEKEPTMWILDAAITHAAYEGAPVEITSGRNHSDIRDTLRKKYKFKSTDSREQIRLLPNYQEGFVTTTMHNGSNPVDDGLPLHFVSRTKAAKIARDAGQITRTSDEPLSSWELGPERY